MARPAILALDHGDEGSVSIRYVHDHLRDLTSAPSAAPDSR